MPVDQWLPGSVGVLLALGCAAWFGRLGFLAVAARSWPEVPGTIVSSTVEPRPRRSARARIRYRYRVGAKEFTGDTLWFGDSLEGNASVVGDQVSAHPVGREVTVRHHPTKPQLCCLQPRAELRVWLFLGGALVMAGVILDALARGE